MDTAPLPPEFAFGDLLRRHRHAAGLTQEELAARTGLSVRGLSDLERGVRLIPRRDTLLLLVEALGLEGHERAALVNAAKRRHPHPRQSGGDLRDAPNLPAQLTPFVGRAAETAAVCALLSQDHVRLVTLTGPGGVGKTRLALHVAQELASSYADGVRFVDLAAIRSPELVTTTIAQRFGLQEMGGRPLHDRLTAMLRDAHLLLLLDNFERVAAAAPQVIALLAACPGLTVLVTSRSPLHVSGERTFPVPSLALPDPEHMQSIAHVAAAEAVRLFLDRAQAAAPQFTLDAANATTVAAICRRLDGLPLAITLAAARVGHLPPTLMLERLERRLPLLTGGPRDQPDRLRTMRDAIHWSHDLLSPDEKRLFRHLAVFSGGFSLAAAEAVEGAAILDDLASLVDGSLVWQDGHAEAPRYRMLEVIREYGLERLAASGEDEGVRRSHAEWCLTLAMQSNAGLPGPEQRIWLERTEAEHDNLRAALAWAVDQGEADLAQRLTASLYRFWYVHGYLSEGRAWAERALTGTQATPPAVRAGAVLAAGWLAWALADFPRAVACAQESLSAFQAQGQSNGAAESLYVLGMVAKDRDDYAAATTILTETLARFRDIGATPWVGFVLNALGIVAYERGDVDRAAALFAEALVEFRCIGEFNGTEYALTNLGRMALAAGEICQAAKYFTESLALRHKHGDQINVAGCLRGLATVAAATDRLADAAMLLGATEVLRERIGLPQPRYHARYHQAIIDCRQGLGEAQYLAMRQLGRQLPLDTAVELAVSVALPDAPMPHRPRPCDGAPSAHNRA